MKPTLRFAAVAALLAVASLVLADAAGEAKKAIQAKMDEYSRNLMARNFDGAKMVVRSVFAKDAVIIGMDGKKMGFEAWLKEMDGHMRSMKSIEKVSLTLATAKVKGNQVVGEERFHLEGTIPSMADPKKTSKFVMHGMSDTVFEKRGGKWVVVRTHDKAVKMMVDGKPVDPSHMADPGHKHKH